MNIKKIIRRELFFIAAILIVFIFLVILSKQVDSPVRKLSLPVDSNQSFQTDADIITDFLDLRKKYPQYNKLDNVELVELISKSYPELIFEIKKIIKEQRGCLKDQSSSRLSKNIYSISLWVVIFVYPICLLTRLFIWVANKYGTNISAFLPFSRKYFISIVVALIYVFILQLIFIENPYSSRESLIVSYIGFIVAVAICIYFWED